MIRYINDCFGNIDDMLSFYRTSKTNVYKLVSWGCIKVNGEVIKKKEFQIKTGDLIEIDDKRIKTSDYIPWKKDLKILYEDEDIIIVYKERGMLVHPDSISNETLDNALSYYFRGQDVVFDHLHRLDLDTFGMLVCSKNILAQSYLSSLFEKRQLDKEYIALIEGHLGKKSGVILKRIASDRHSNKQITSNTGKDAKTIYKVIEESKEFTKVLVKIEGGRKHQIRCHFASIGHPIVGDKLYGSKYLDRELMLQFFKVEFIHPRTKKPFSFEIEQEF